MSQRPEAEWVRPRIAEAIAKAGVHIWPIHVQNAIVDEVISILLEDRETSASLVHTACTHYEGILHEENLRRLADVIECRIEKEPGQVTLDIE